MNNRVEIMEVGLRDGLQNVDQHISVDDRLSIIDGLIEKATSFVEGIIDKATMVLQAAQDAIDSIICQIRSRVGPGLISDS